MKLKLSAALLAVAALLAPLSIAAQLAQNPAEAKSAAAAAYGKLPLSFEPTVDSARFIAHSGSYTVSIGTRESAIAVATGKSGKIQTLRFAFDNASPAAPLQAIDPQPGVTNYYLGADSNKWRLGVKSYGRLRAQSVYPGIDVVYYGDHRRLEFDFVVAPQADPAAIALSFAGMDKFYKDADGDLVAEVGGQPVRFAKPVAYQKVDGTSKPVAADYELTANGKVQLRLGDYDRNAELVVDPVVSYATYLGGASADVANGIAVDSFGSAYVTGQTCSSTDFPNSPNPNGFDFEGACDAFVTKYTADGTGYIYTVILGGSTPAGATASGNGIALDSSNYAYIVGTTNIKDLPGTIAPTNPVSSPNSYQGGDSDAFIVILDNFGFLVRSTYLGGSGADAGYAIAVDQAVSPAHPNVTVVGQTCSQDFPAYNAFETKVEACVAFVTKLDNKLDIASKVNGTITPFASALTPAPPSGGGKTYYFSEFFGGQPVAPYPTAGAWQPFTNYPAGAIVEDNQATPHIELALNSGTSGAYIPAATTTNLPVPNWNTTPLGITLEGSMSWEDLGVPGIPPNAFTEAYGVAIDPPGDIFFAGGTNTAALASTLWPCSNGANGAWVLKVFGNGGGCAYEWTLEATPTDVTATIDTARAIAVDSSGRAYVVGTATNSLGTTGNSYQHANGGLANAFLVRVNQLGSAIDYSTYFGGSGKDQGLGVAVDGNLSPYVTGGTSSIDFPTINPLTNPNSGNPLPLSGTEGAFITKFTSDGSALIFSSYLGGSQADQANAIAVIPDTAQPTYVDMYVAGITTSPDLLTTLLEQPMSAPNYAPPQPIFGGGGNSDAFLAMIPGASIPVVTVLPGSLTFPAQDVGTTSAPQAVIYTNTNLISTVQINAISFANTITGDPSEFQQAGGNGTPPDCSPGSQVGPGLTCQILVIFTPSAQSLQTGTLTISDNVTTKPHTVNLRGQGAVPVDNFSPSNLTFAATAPYQTIGSPTAAQTVTLKNTGQGPLNISSIAITGTNPSDFSQNDTCGAQLASGSSCTISVIFTPGASGLRSATLTVSDNAAGSPHSIPLQGTGAQVVAPTITPLTLTYTAQPLFVTSAAQTVTVTNNDTASTLSLSSSVSAGYFAEQALTGSCGATLAPKASCVIGVTFTPTAACSGSSCTGTLSIYSNAASSAVVVQLTGASGVAASGTIQVSPTTLPFGNQLEYTTSTAQTVTVTNGSTTSLLTITSIAITGNSDFAIASNGCPLSPATLATSASCTVTVTFTPSTLVSESATLNVVASAANSPQQVTLTGTGSGTTASTAPFTVTPQSPGGVSITQGSTAQYTLTVTPLNGFSNPIAFTCSGPNGSSCSISPNPLTMDGTTIKTATLTVITTGGNGTTAAVRFGARPVLLALLPFSIFGMLLVGKRRSYLLALVLVALSLFMGVVSCGGGSSTASTSGALAPATYQVTLTATSSINSSQSQTMTLPLVVTSK